jgi:curved DNA-binding protein CbpA
MYQAFTDVEIIDVAAGPTFDRGSGTRDDPYIVLHLRPTAPPELVNAAHKVLAKLNHPDAGGDTITMQRINSAVESIREVSR